MIPPVLLIQNVVQEDGLKPAVSDTVVQYKVRIKPSARTWYPYSGSVYAGCVISIVLGSPSAPMDPIFGLSMLSGMLSTAPIDFLNELIVACVIISLFIEHPSLSKVECAPL